MEAGQKIFVRKPSWWRSERELFDHTRARVGSFRLTSMWTYNAAECESLGKKLSMEFTNWYMNKIEVKDAGGQSVGSAEMNMWGMRAAITFGGKEYSWKPNMWGTRFTILGADGRELIRVSERYGFEREAPAEILQHIDTSEAVTLVLIGTFLMRSVEMQGASAGV